MAILMPGPEGVIWKEKDQVLNKMFLAPYMKKRLLDASKQLDLL